MTKDNEVVIVTISAQVANTEQMKAAVEGQTGDPNPFFCPEVVEGKPYKGHAHTSPPASVVKSDITPIVL